METLFAAYGTLRRHDEASAIMVRAEREVSGPGMEAARHNLCNARCNARLAKLDVDSAFAIWSEAEQYAAASDNPVLRARCQQRLTIPLLYMGRLDETCDMAKRAIDSSHTIRTTGDLSIALTCATTAALAQGRLREASAMGEQALQLIRETRYANSSVDLVAALACLHCWRGEFATARAVINTLMDPTFIFDNPAPFRHTVERLIELVDSYGGRGPDSPVGVPPVAGRSYSVNRLRRYCMTIDMAAMHNQSQVIAPANHALAVLSEHGIVFSSGWVYLLPRMQGIGAHMTGDHDAAAMHFEQALDVCERAGASAERANTLLDWARLDADQGRHAVAVCKLDQAMASYARFGMMAMHHQAELLRKRLTGTSLTAGNGGEHDDRTYGTGPQ